ncbi:type I secretion C-terminal target domain-containing protein [Aurantimonas sp. Leaf443]|uniref:type I secretion C-terminal target domain-containing protein n=1 Tax=Aurantimonas sp. Leaf443 TaxID=1736378 RepID=UPI0007015D14|nr:type I secretion C-terminal target domain-containing protein [Aurantimonas sp. Leaf443]KQT85082.1 hypothetical protein ASG48_07280 [Aurantimonas sp. Leaf443]
MAIDLSNFTSVLDENFDKGLSVYDGTSGIWSTGPRRDVLVTNGPQSVFLSDATATSDGKGVGIDPLEVKDGVLHIKSGVIPQANLAAVQDALKLAGQEQYVDKAKYYTGMIATNETLGQAYGFFEIKAQVPAGKGHWSAFWLAPSGLGWPPEIDIFEAYGKGLNARTGADNQFNTAVFFDAVDADGNKTQNVDITNPYAVDENGNPESPTVKTKQGGEQSIFHERTNALEEFGADIYSGMWTYATKWTPETITFYFGKDHDSLVEIYKAPTPKDATAPMYLIANDQISSTFGWNPVEGEDHLTFAEGNDLKIDYIKVWALNPEAELKGTGKGATLVDGDGDTKIVGTAGNDRIVTGGGQDMLTLNGGADTIFIEKGIGNKIVTGFGPDDRMVLDGFFFDGVQDVMARLTQQGNDVWLANGADPANPQTIIFKDAKVSNFQQDDFDVRWSVTQNVWADAGVNGSRLSDTDNDGIVQGTNVGSKLSDTPSGFNGARTLIGGKGGDEFYVYSADTKIVEKTNGGIDTVYTAKNIVLAENVENMTSLGTVDGQIMTGNSGGNRLIGSARKEVFVGGKGDDLIVTGGGADRIVYAAGDGNDTVRGFGSDDVLQLSGFKFPAFADLQKRLISIGTDTLVDLGAGQSVILQGVKASTLTAANFAFDTGASTVVGSLSYKNYIPTLTSAGAIEVDPVITAPTSPVVKPTSPSSGSLAPVVGTDADDKIVWKTGQSTTISGGKGNDQISGSLGADTISGDAGNDILRGRDGDDTIRGGAGDDRLLGEAGHDTLLGEDGNDVLNGGEGDDLLDGGIGNDTLVAGNGNDRVLGGAGDDVVKGEAGNDILNGGLGSDRLFGGNGADTFAFTDFNKGEMDRVMDFSRLQGDKIDLSGLFQVDVTSQTMYSYVNVMETKAGTVISVDTDGAANGQHFETLALIMNAKVADVLAGLIV